MNQRRESRTFLQSVGNGPEQELDIAGAALHLAALTRSKVDLDPAELHLDTLTRDVAARAQIEAPVSAEAAAGILAGVVAGENQYRGDDQTYDDLQNADLLSVIERRKGLPVALGILYIHVARAQGWRAFGLNFPGHFLIALEFEGSRAILDPFHEGVCRTPPELRELLKMVTGQDAELSADVFAPVPDRGVLLRLLSNIRLRLLQMRRLEDASETIDAMLLIAPQQPELWRDAGMLQAQLGNLGAAIEALETAIARDPNGTRQQETAALLQHLRQRLN
jgi:regulator of sirC expression with transglutaminase-like and TPR domain